MLFLGQKGLLEYTRTHEKSNIVGIFRLVTVIKTRINTLEYRRKLLRHW